MLGAWWYKLQFFINKIIFTRKGNRLLRYGVPVALSLLVFSTKAYFYPLLGESAPFLLLAFVVMVSAWYGGLGPGILATFLSAFVNQLFFLTPSFALKGGDNYFRTLVFVLEGILIVIIAEARRQAENQKDEFIAIVSHELKNPLATMKAYVELMNKKLKKSKDFKLHEYATRINGNIERVTSLINDLHDVTKIEAGKFSYNDEKFLLSNLVKIIVDDQKLLTTSHKIEMSGMSKKYFYGDKYRIGQVLINLISNAVKYSPKSQVVNVRVRDTMAGTEISIRDRGRGIKSADQARVFDRFYRGSLESKIQGLGMGLYISSEIVKRHKGRMWLKSKPGKGSIFFVWLPTQKNK